MVGTARALGSWPRWFIPAALLSALLCWLLQQLTPPMAATVAPPLPPAAQAPARSGDHTAAGLLLATDLHGALQSARAALPEDQWRALRRRVDDACVVPSLLRLEGRREADPRRDWARAALEQRCAGLPMPSLYRPGLEVRAERSDELPLPAAPEALRSLRQARDGQALVQAWIEAYLADALPQERIFADGRRLLPADAEMVITVVQDWRDCARHRACGSNSLLTLKVCALHGCAPGADLLEAWHEALSPRDFSAARAVHEWLLVEVPVDAG
jgi:hypothetical protein